MRRSLSVRIATILLVVSLAAPAMASPREDSPIDRFERAVSRIMHQIVRIIHTTDMPVISPVKP